MLVNPVKFGRRKRQGGNIPCTHIAIEENYDENGGVLMSVVIEICGAPEGAPRRIHMPNDADEFYVMDDRGDHQNSYKFERMKRASMEAQRTRTSDRVPLSALDAARREVRP